jgi:hypothetical protein
MNHYLENGLHRRQRDLVRESADGFYVAPPEAGPAKPHPQPPLRAGTSRGFWCRITLVLAWCCACALAGIASGADIIPLTAAHAHNDYEHARPLLDALDHGFCSIEADVHLVDGQLLVAHNRSQTAPGRTLASLYLDPLRERVRQNQGRVYRDGPVVWLFIDLKSEAEASYASLSAILTNYSSILTRFEDGRTITNALWVVVTGNRPRETIARQNPRFCSYDGLLSDLDKETPSSLTPIISEQWSSLFAWRGSGELPDNDAAKLKKIIEQAHRQNKWVRFWGAPDQAHAWQVLQKAGVDLINTDDLDGLRSFLINARH